MISNSALPSIRRHDASFLPSSSCRPTSPVFLGVSTCTLVGDGLQDRGAGRGGHVFRELSPSTSPQVTSPEDLLAFKAKN